MIKEFFTTIWEKTKQAGRWIKSKAKQLLIWVGIIGVATASTLVVQDLTKNEISLEKISQKYEQSIEIKDKYQLEGGLLTRVAKADPKDRIVVEIGDKEATEFVPKIKISRWDEVDFTITPNIEGVATKDKDLTFEGDKIKFDTPKMSYEIYEYTEGEGGYKFIWYLNEKPADTKDFKVEFKIETNGLDFFYQPPLTQEYQNGYSEQFQKEIVVSETQVKDLDGSILVERPENVVGSYAVYHSTKGGLNDINGMDYRVGKFGHIYRPRIYDADGKETWGILHIENGIYSVEIPQSFLDTAVYPIKSNDEIGYIGEGTGSFLSNPDGCAGSNLNTSVTTGGDVDSIQFYGRYAISGTLVKGFITEDFTIISNGVSPIKTVDSSSNDWWIVNYSIKPTLEDSTTYRPWFVNDYYIYIATDTGSGTNSYYDTNDYDDPENPPSPSAATAKYSIYATFTAAEPEGTNIQINIGDSWKVVEGVWINIGDAWKAVEGMQENIGDEWKTIY